MAHQLVITEIGNRALAVRHAVDQRIVMNDEPVIPRLVNIELNEIDTELGGIRKGKPGIFRPQMRAAAMRGNEGHKGSLCFPPPSLPP